MLQVDLKQDDARIAAEIRAQCAQFGTVKDMKIHRTAKCYVIIEMATHDEALSLGAHFRRTCFGNSVLLHLEQKV
jgi:hypothetical protein